MRQCIIKNCKNIENNNCSSKISYHKIPIEMRSVLRNALYLNSDDITKDSRICSVHFENSDFETKQILKKGVMPSLFLPLKANLDDDEDIISCQITDFPRICRTCKQGEELIPLSELNENILEILRTSAKLKLDEDDNFPKNICPKCVSCLEDFGDFIYRCQNAELAFQTCIIRFDHDYIFTNKKNITTENNVRLNCDCDPSDSENEIKLEDMNTLINEIEVFNSNLTDIFEQNLNMIESNFKIEEMDIDDCGSKENLNEKDDIFNTASGSQIFINNQIELNKPDSTNIEQKIKEDTSSIFSDNSEYEVEYLDDMYDRSTYTKIEKPLLQDVINNKCKLDFLLNQSSSSHEHESGSIILKNKSQLLNKNTELLNTKRKLSKEKYYILRSPENNTIESDDSNGNQKSFNDTGSSFPGKIDSSEVEFVDMYDIISSPTNKKILLSQNSDSGSNEHKLIKILKKKNALIMNKNDELKKMETSNQKRLTPLESSIKKNVNIDNIKTVELKKLDINAIKNQKGMIKFVRNRNKVIQTYSKDNQKIFQSNSVIPSKESVLKKILLHSNANNNKTICQSVESGSNNITQSYDSGIEVQTKESVNKRILLYPDKSGNKTISDSVESGSSSTVQSNESGSKVLSKESVLKRILLHSNKSNNKTIFQVVETGSNSTIILNESSSEISSKENFLKKILLRPNKSKAISQSNESSNDGDKPITQSFESGSKEMIQSSNKNDTTSLKTDSSNSETTVLNEKILDQLKINSVSGKIQRESFLKAASKIEANLERKLNNVRKLLKTVIQLNDKSENDITSNQNDATPLITKNHCSPKRIMNQDQETSSIIKKRKIMPEKSSSDTIIISNGPELTICDSNELKQMNAYECLNCAQRFPTYEICKDHIFTEHTLPLTKKN